MTDNEKRKWKYGLIYGILILLICIGLLVLAARLGWVNVPFLPGPEETGEAGTSASAGNSTTAAPGTSAGASTTVGTSAGNSTGTSAATGTGAVTTKAAVTTGESAVTTVKEYNMDDDTSSWNTGSNPAGTLSPMDPASATEAQTSSPEQTTLPVDRTTDTPATTRSPNTTRDPHVTTRSPETTTAPQTNYTPDPAITIIPPTTMPDGRMMTIGDRIEDQYLVAPDGTLVHGYWEMDMDEAYFFIDWPQLQEGETQRGWNWVPYYHILEAGTFVGMDGWVDFYPDVNLPPYQKPPHSIDTSEHTVLPGSWW